MALKTVYIPELGALQQSGVVTIGGEEHRHLAVARVEHGETVELFDGNGAVWDARVVALGKKDTTVEVVARRFCEREPYDLILGLSLIRSAAFEWALEKAVEIGVTRIIPILADRSNTSAARSMDRLERIIVEAAKQSKRRYLPVIEPARKFQEILEFQAASRIAFVERDGLWLEGPRLQGSVLYLVGPEGGWTERELQQFTAAGFYAATLGSGILKAETAAIAGAVLIRYLQQAARTNAEKLNTEMGG
jgi:16S rRNA (uracil1498-N3)-methyltransferase